jgi:hypothetical protein
VPAGRSSCSDGSGCIAAAGLLLKVDSSNLHLLMRKV